ncbi:unnamed protein product [Prorocentrum cordatum]|uniref:SET domain-containing protein n=1 Tax=Prorocentrum cordatum TaxID=2364126 RepID=A0ABN9ULU1_9DINO|nr:unnamed protein product [Polarella glacialis]
MGLLDLRCAALFVGCALARGAGARPPLSPLPPSRPRPSRTAPSGPSRCGMPRPLPVAPWRPRRRPAAGSAPALLLLLAGGGGGAAAGSQEPVAPLERIPCSRDAPDLGFAAMCAWLEDTCKAKGTSRVHVASFPHGGAPVRGLGVSSDVAKGDHVFCIPKACWLNEDVLPDPFDDGPGTHCTSNERMALWLANEVKKGPESFYSPYFPVLPTEEAYRRFHPAYLEGFQLDESVDLWKMWLGRLHLCHGGRESPTWAEVKLTYVWLLTRQFGGVGMTPLADMPNTAPEPELNVQQILNHGGDFCLKALRDLPAGTELLVDYGAPHHSPTLMFLIYGFALEREHHNVTVPSAEEYASAEYMLSPRDGCAGLRPPEFQLPPDAGPPLQNLARFAARHCRAPLDEL